ncbi:prenyltransferase/squalene oxidase repeat-containing protein [Schlesneria sp.]|uniref:prenyltransferase/squalene oxidase repeat-containing protein n=1 Tax=Schlesneria sp. TaxID=2762018 RepID=UPI002EF5B24C
MAHPYLFRLDERVARGLSQWEPADRERHRQFLLSQQNPDGGFGGRGIPVEYANEEPDERESDLYYTAFGVRALSALRLFTAEDARRVAAYLDGARHQNANVIDVVSWLYSALMVQATAGIDLLVAADSDWPQALAARLEGFRSSDGGYAKTHEGAIGSTYHSFLVALCYELIGQPLPAAESLVEFIRSRQRDDGGFVEIAPMKRSGTNPTAAAIGVLTLHSIIGPNLRDDVLGYLNDVRSDEGGFQANSRIPFADSLSTFTGFLTCLDLHDHSTVDPKRLEQFILALEHPTGGFRAATWDQSTDVEYTYYALGTLGLLWSETPLKR